MLIYTTKNLTDVLPLESKKIAQCGINVNNMKQIIIDGVVHSILEVVDPAVFNSVRKVLVQELTVEDRDQLVARLEEEFNKNAEEQYKQTESYKMDLLLEQLDQQDVILAELTYDNMMMKEDSVAVSSLGEPSYKYAMIKRWFEKGLWDENMVNNAVIKGLISEEEKQQIF